MRSRFVAWITAWLVLAAVVLLLGGCATATPAQPAPNPVAKPCPAAQVLPDEPAERLVVEDYEIKPYIVNRTAWIAHARALRTKLEACK